MTLPVELPGSSRKKRKALNVQHVILELELFEPTKSKYPIFNYKDLLKEHLNESDSSGDDERFHDREAEDLVKRLEEKYGNKRDKKGKKIKFGRAEDFIDKTAGYDLSDSFIDDGEAYDELIPSTLDTARKGFYVNKGKLEFKSVFSGDEQDASEVDSDDDRPSTSRQQEPKKKKCAKEAVTDAADSSTASLNDSIMSVINTSKKQLGNSALRAAAQSIKKKRLSAGMPPTLRAALANRQPLKRGPKPKNKNISTPSSGAPQSTAELASFLAEMAGGKFNTEELENIYRDVNVSPDRLKPKLSANTTTPPTKRVRIDTSDEESSPNVPVATPDRMSGGRPPNAPAVKAPLTWSNELKAMIKHFKDETRKFGAPDNKFRLHHEHVEMCIKIEERCISDGMNMPQKSAVMDSLARWVKIQKQSLYIRMKTYKDRKANGTLSPQKAAAALAASKNVGSANALAVPTAQKTSKPEKSEVKSPKTEKSTTPIRPSAPPPTSTASEVKNEKQSPVDRLIASVVASVASSSSSKSSDNPSQRSITDVVDAVRSKKQEATAASSTTATRPAGSAASTTKTSGRPAGSALAKPATLPASGNKKATTTSPPTSASSAATLSQTLTQDVMANLASLTAAVKDQVEKQDRAHTALIQMAIASNSPRPKKEFIWNDELKKAVSAMISMIIKATATVSQSPPEQATSIVRFFDVSVLPLFGSNDWMTFAKLIAQLQSMVPSGLNLTSCLYYQRRVEGEAQARKQQPTQARPATTQQPKKQRTTANPTEKRGKPLAVPSSAPKAAPSTTAGTTAQSKTSAPSASSAPSTSLSNGSSGAVIQKRGSLDTLTSTVSVNRPVETSKAADDIQIMAGKEAHAKLQSSAARSSQAGAAPQDQSIRQQNDSQQHLTSTMLLESFEAQKKQKQDQLKKQQHDRLKQEQAQKQRLAQDQLRKFQEDHLHKELEERAAQLQLLQLQAHKEQEVQRQVQEQQELQRRRQQQEQLQQRQQQERQKQQEEQLKQRQLQEQQERQRLAAQQQQEEAQRRMLQALEEQRLEQERKRQQQEQLKQQQLQEKQRLEQERKKQQQLLIQQQQLQEKQRLEQERQRQQQEQEKQRLEQERQRQQQEHLKQQQQLQERKRLEQEQRNQLQQQEQEQLRRQQKQHQEQMQLQHQMQQQQLQLQEQRRLQQQQYGSPVGRSQLGSSPNEVGSYSQQQLHQSPPVAFPSSPMGVPSSPTIQRHSTPVPQQLSRPMMTLADSLPTVGVSPFSVGSSSYPTQQSSVYYTSPQKSHQQQGMASSPMAQSPMQSLPSASNQPMNIQQQLLQLNERGMLNPAEMHQLMSGNMSMSEIQRVIYDRCQQVGSLRQQPQSGQQQGQQHGAFGGSNFYH